MEKKKGLRGSALVRIRKARIEDLPSILDVYAAAFEGSKKTAPAKAKKIFNRMKSYPNYDLYVATAGGRVAGVFALLIMDNLVNNGTSSAVLEDVAVHPDRQGLGIGKRMIRFAREVCGKEGCYKMALSSNLKRRSAHRFYKSMGFKKHGYSDRFKELASKHLDKAGAYAVQDAGDRFIEKIKGRFDTVVGLPMNLVHKFLKQAELCSR